jgi:hypothetical protein
MNKIEKAKELLRTTDLTNGQIRSQLKCRGQIVSDALKELGATFSKDRKRRMYSVSKLGDKNPMKGKYGVEHPNYRGVIDDCKGYKLILKPEWYTGRKGSKHIFLHSAVYCEASNLTEVPKGYVIHHCDQNPHNNYFSNLILVTLAEHASLHKFIEGATTISKESTAKWLEARRANK